LPIRNELRTEQSDRAHASVPPAGGGPVGGREGAGGVDRAGGVAAARGGGVAFARPIGSAIRGAGAAGASSLLPAPPPVFRFGNFGTPPANRPPPPPPPPPPPLAAPFSSLRTGLDLSTVTAFFSLPFLKPVIAPNRPEREGSDGGRSPPPPDGASGASGASGAAGATGAGAALGAARGAARGGVCVGRARGTGDGAHGRSAAHSDRSGERRRIGQNRSTYRARRCRWCATNGGGRDGRGRRFRSVRSLRGCAQHSGITHTPAAAQAEDQRAGRGEGRSVNCLFSRYLPALRAAQMMAESVSACGLQPAAGRGSAWQV
jgi:hypothetical protein